MMRKYHVQISKGGARDHTLHRPYWNMAFDTGIFVVSVKFVRFVEAGVALENREVEASK